MNCDICGPLGDGIREMKYLPLFVLGSEGITVCHSCEMEMVTFVCMLRRMAGKARKEMAKNWKEIES